ncbi:unnamed protein product, partial [Rotaria magnacalcarata]
LCCLHPQMLRYNNGQPKALSDYTISDFYDVYYTWDRDDDKLGNEYILMCTGLGDFYIFNSMLYQYYHHYHQ